MLRRYSRLNAIVTALAVVALLALVPAVNFGSSDLRAEAGHHFHGLAESEIGLEAGTSHDCCLPDMSAASCVPVCAFACGFLVCAAEPGLSFARPSKWAPSAAALLIGTGPQSPTPPPKASG